MAFRRLFERHYARLVRFLYRRLGDWDEAEELAQEAFVRLLVRRPRRPEAWLYAVAANLARDAARGDARRAHHMRALSGEAVGDAVGRAEDGPERAVEREETSRRVRATLEALSERDRTLLLLRGNGLSYREIAGVLGVAATSVGPLLTRAQRRFLRRYERWTGGEDVGERESSA